MTKLNISHPDSRLTMPDEAPVDLVDQIKEAITRLVSERDITSDENGYVTFVTKDSRQISGLNNLLNNARYYGILTYRLSSNKGETEYIIFYDLFPEIKGEASETREDIANTLRV